MLRCPSALLVLRCCWWCVLRLLVCCDRVRRFFAVRRVSCRRSCRAARLPPCGSPAAGRLPFCLDSLCGVPLVLLVNSFNLRFSTFGKFGGISGFFGCAGAGFTFRRRPASFTAGGGVFSRSSSKFGVPSLAHRQNYREKIRKNASKTCKSETFSYIKAKFFAEKQKEKPQK